MKYRQQLVIANGLLSLIAILLFALVFVVYQQRPVTRAELMQLAEQDDDDGVAARRSKIPLVAVSGTVDVDVQNNSLDVEVTNTTLTVEIDR